MAARVVAFRKGLSEMGYAEGQNVQVEYHWLEGIYEQLNSAPNDVIRRRVVGDCHSRQHSCLAGR